MQRSSVADHVGENTVNDNSRQDLRVRILLADTDRRPYTARIAMALAEVGCEVSVVATGKHPVQKTTFIRRNFAYSALRPLSSLVHAIATTKPDLIIPCDDRSVEHLHQLHVRCSVKDLTLPLERLVENSLGDPASFPIVTSRYDFLMTASREGIRVPATRLISSLDDLREWRSERPFPWVLKADGTWGGRGVRLAYKFEDATKYFDKLSRPCDFRRAIKRRFINRDSFYLREWWLGRAPKIVAQRFIDGRPANCAVFCSKGEVLASIAVEVVSASGLTGPASVVRVIEGQEMMQAAAAIASRLRLSGFFGLDFVLDEAGASYLLEINPRCTPPCHLSVGDGRDLVRALWKQLSGQTAPARRIQTENRMIAYFPQAWLENSEFLHSSFHDVPEGEPELERELLQPWPDRTLTSRLFTRLALGVASKD